MSVVLDIPMPKTCADCPLEIVEDDGLHNRICSVIEKNTEYDRYFRRLHYCPIVCEYNLKALGEHVGERALDRYEYKGKTLREWIKKIRDSEVTE